MKFRLSLNGTITARVEASNLGIDTANVTALDLGLPRDADISDVSIDGEVDVSAYVGIVAHEVNAEDMPLFDAYDALSDALGGDITIENADYEITNSPPGFTDVESEVDTDTALRVFAALDRHGWDVL